MDNKLMQDIVSGSLILSAIKLRNKISFTSWWDHFSAIVSAIPAVGGTLSVEIQSVRDSAADYQAYEFFRKFTCFICELGELTDTQRKEFVSEVEKVAKDASGNVIMGLVDRLDNINKERILANLVIAKGQNAISIEDFFRLSSMLERIPYVDLAKLELYNQDFYDDEGDSELLFATGALQQSVIDADTGNKYVLSKLGRKLLRFGLGLKVEDMQTIGTKVAKIEWDNMSDLKPISKEEIENIIERQ
ncbi:MAG: hypothetical protein E7072_06800 [Bacteroidales bacterium]|nr:hypothetical protein [Bacteroidales bacterium]